MGCSGGLTGELAWWIAGGLVEIIVWWIIGKSFGVCSFGKLVCRLMDWFCMSFWWVAFSLQMNALVA